MRRATYLLIGFFSLFWLAGCIGPVNSYAPYQASNYRPVFLGYAAKKGGIYTNVSDAPFPSETTARDQVITRTLEESHFGPPVSFYVDPALQQGSPYRVELAFNPAINASADKLCQSSEVPRSDYPDQIRVMAAFCNSDYLLTSTVAWIPRVDNPADPTFTQLMRQVGVQIFPPQGDIRDRNPFIIFE
ncbi:MAG: hypothetical protein AAF530_01765 [Pseudomonadota bacterium]